MISYHCEWIFRVLDAFESQKKVILMKSWLSMIIKTLWRRIKAILLKVWINSAISEEMAENVMLFVIIFLTFAFLLCLMAWSK